MEKHWLIASSADPKKLSRTVAGLAQFIPAILGLLSIVGITAITSADLTAIFESAASAILALWAAFAAVQTLIGAVRKVYIKVFK